jgi:magnesium-transporting ATPase (P-type)
MQQPRFRESLLDAIDSIMLLILTVCAFFSMVSGMVFDRHTGWVEGVCILVTMILIILITSFKDWIKDLQYTKHLSLTKDEELPVIRGKMGVIQMINIWELVVGDLVILKVGDQVPADCVIADAESRIRVNESQSN